MARYRKGDPDRHPGKRAFFGVSMHEDDAKQLRAEAQRHRITVPELIRRKIGVSVPLQVLRPKTKGQTTPVTVHYHVKPEGGSKESKESKERGEPKEAPRKPSRELIEEPRAPAPVTPSPSHAPFLRLPPLLLAKK